MRVFVILVKIVNTYLTEQFKYQKHEKREGRAENKVRQLPLRHHSSLREISHNNRGCKLKNNKNTKNMKNMKYARPKMYCEKLKIISQIK